MNKLDKRTLWTYSIGSVGRDAAFTLVSMFLIVYIQYTVQLTLGQYTAISIIMILALVWDAVNDLLMGMIVENTRWKCGKFKPWIMIGAVSNAIVIICLFSIRPSGWLYVLFFGLAYIAWGMTYTMNDIAYYGMLPSLTSDAQERSTLVALMNIFISIGQFAVAVVVPMLVAGNAISAYRTIALAVSFILVIFQLITVIGVRERPRRDKEKVSLKGIYRIFRGNDQLSAMGLVAFLYYIGSGLLIMFGMNFFYFEFSYQRGGELITVFTVMYGLGTLGAQLFFPFIVKHLNRKQIMSISTLALFLTYLLFLSVGYVLPKSPLIIYVLGFLIFFFQGTLLLLVIIMINNTIEYDELRTGQRHDAVISAVRSFAVKLATGVNQGIVAFVLIISGIYQLSQGISDLEVAVGEGQIVGSQAVKLADGLIAQASFRQVFLLRLGIVVFPMAAFIAMYYVWRKHYRLDEPTYEKILVELAERNRTVTENKS